MTINHARDGARHLLRAAALGSALALAGCAAQPIASFEGPEITSASAQAQHDLYFQPGSPSLAGGEAGRLQQFLAALVLRPQDDIVLVLGATGSDVLDARRLDVASKVLPRKPARTSIVAPTGFSNLGFRPDAAFVQVVRYDRIIVDCRNYGRTPEELENLVNFPPMGCTNAVNLASMTAEPRDLSAPRRLRGSDGVTSVAAVERYRTGKVITTALDSVGD